MSKSSSDSQSTTFTFVCETCGQVLVYNHRVSKQRKYCDECYDRHMADRQRKNKHQTSTDVHVSHATGIIQQYLAEWGGSKRFVKPIEVVAWLRGHPDKRPPFWTTEKTAHRYISESLKTVFGYKPFTRYVYWKE